MAYVSHNFEQGQVLNASALNEMDKGIVDNSTPFIITVTEDGSVYSSNKTYNEVLEAFNNGRSIYMCYSYFCIPLSEYNQDDEQFIFCRDTQSQYASFILSSISKNMTVKQLAKGPLYINLTRSGDTYSVDKTFSDITTALGIGRNIQMVFGTISVQISGSCTHTFDGNIKEAYCFKYFYADDTGIQGWNVYISSDNDVAYYDYQIQI